MKLQLQHNPKYVNLGPRFVAVGIDSLVYSVVLSYFLNQLAKLQSLHAFIPALLQTITYIWLPSAVIYSWGLLVMLTLTGYTPGKWLCGLQVLDEYEHRLGFLAILIREWLAKRVSNAILGLGNLTMAVDVRHQAWHDQMVGSFVWKRQGNMFAAILLLGVLMGLQGYFMYAGFTHLQHNSGLVNDVMFMVEPIKGMFN